jgi:hypothetical protein
MGTGGLTTPSFPTPLNYGIPIKKFNRVRAGEMEVAPVLT